MFNIQNAIASLLGCTNTNTVYFQYLLKTYNDLVKLIQNNSYNKIQNLNQNKCLKIIFGEATQNLDNFIYGNNSSKIAKNSFLPPATLLGLPCGKGSGFKASDLHDYIAKENLVVVDLFPIPLPSEIYNSTIMNSTLNTINSLGGEQEKYIDMKVDEIILLANSLKVNDIKTTPRYSKTNVTNMANEFNNRLSQKLKTIPNIKLTSQTTALSNAAGNLDKKLFNLFLIY